MRWFLLTAILGLCGCTAPPAPGASDGANAALAAIGTPFLIAAKIPLCALTLVAAGPVAAVSEVSDPDTQFGHDIRQGLSGGIAQNCGPPYAATP